MAKKPSRKKKAAGAKPELAQLRAIERLLHQQDYQAVVRRIRPLVQQFPDHSGLRRSLIDALNAAEGTGPAGLAAFDWAEQRRNSLSAQEALLAYAATLSLPALVGRAARRIGELGGDVPGGVPDPADLEELSCDSLGLGSSLEDLERFEIGQLHLVGKNVLGAVRWLDGMAQPPARNNRALALFHLQRIDEALASFTDVWQAHPDNLFALSWVIQLRFYQGDETGALDLCTVLAAGVPSYLDHAMSQLQVLLLMQQNEAALAAFGKALAGRMDDGASARAAALLRHYGACAACRLGRRSEASDRWREARDIDSDLQLASANLDELKRGAKSHAFPEVLEAHLILPVHLITALRNLKRDADLGVFDASNAYLEAAYISGDEVTRGMASLPLKYRAGQGDTDAIRRLKAFARLPIGSKLDRFSYLRFLRQKALIGAEELMEVWGNDGLMELKLVSTIVDRETPSSGLPADLDEMLSRSIELMQDRRIDEAEPLLEQLLDRVPGHPVATSNLAALREMQGRRDEIRPLLRQVAAEHPEYLFGRCNLARLLIMDGKLEEAEGLLSGLAERERMHVQDVFTLYGTLAMLHMGKGDGATAQRFLASLEPLVETEDDEYRLEQARDIVNRVMPKGAFGSILRRMASFGSSSDKRRP